MTQRHHRLHRMVRPLLLLAAIVTLLGVGTAPTRAQATNGEWSVIPTSSGQDGGARTSFVFEAAAGVTISDSVTIQNLTATEKSFKIFGADAFNTPGEGAFAIHGPEAPPTDAGAWIALAATEWTVPAGMQASIPFTVAIPAGATPGDHAGGISVLDLETATDTSSETVQLEVQRAVAVPVFVRIAGELQQSARVTDLEASYDAPFVPGIQKGHTKVTFTLVNDGNVRLSADASTTLSALLGLGDATFDDRSIPHLLPGNSARVTVEAEGGPWLGRGTARVHVSAEGLDITRSTSFFVVPWLLVIVVLFVVVAFAWARRRRRRRAEPSRPAPSKEPRAEALT